MGVYNVAVIFYVAKNVYESAFHSSFVTVMSCTVVEVSLLSRDV